MAAIHDRLRSNLDHVVFLCIVLVLWQMLVSPDSIIPTPVQIVGAFVWFYEDGRVVGALYSALGSIFLGYFIAIIVGIPLGVAMGVNQHAHNIFDPYVNALYVVPFGALVPAMVIWFGTGLQVRVVVVFFFCIFPIVINSMEGAKTVPASLVDAAQAFGGERLFIIRNVVIPYEIAYIIAGLRLGIGRAVRGLVVTEILISVTGFGLLIHERSIAFDMAGVVGLVIILMLLGVVLTGTLKVIEKRAIHWDIATAA